MQSFSSETATWPRKTLNDVLLNVNAVLPYIISSWGNKTRWHNGYKTQCNYKNV